MSVRKRLIESVLPPFMLTHYFEMIVTTQGTISLLLSGI
jgi:hypothetical protein